MTNLTKDETYWLSALYECTKMGKISLETLKSALNKSELKVVDKTAEENKAGDLAQMRKHFSEWREYAQKNITDAKEALRQAYERADKLERDIEEYEK